MQIEMSVSESVKLKMAFWTGKFYSDSFLIEFSMAVESFAGNGRRIPAPFPLGEISGRRPNANLILENGTNHWRRWQPQSIKIFWKLNFPRIWAIQKYKRFFPECKNPSECHLDSFSSIFHHPPSAFLFLLFLFLLLPPPPPSIS